MESTLTYIHVLLMGVSSIIGAIICRLITTTYMYDKIASMYVYLIKLNNCNYKNECNANVLLNYEKNNNKINPLMTKINVSKSNCIILLISSDSEGSCIYFVSRDPNGKPTVSTFNSIPGKKTGYINILCDNSTGYIHLYTDSCTDHAFNLKIKKIKY